MKRFLEYLCESAPSAEALEVEEKLKALGIELQIRARKPSQSANVIVIELPGSNRDEVLNDIAEKLNGTRVSRPNHLSTIGFTQVGNVKIFAKTTGNTGSGTSGKKNEDTLAAAISMYCDANNPIDIVFSDEHGKKFECLQIIQAELVGTHVSNNRKADIILHGKRKDYPLSLKKDSAEFWGSCQKWSDQAIEALDKKVAAGEVSIVPQVNGEVKISPTIAYKPTAEQIKDIAFGSDILPNGCIIQKTFGSDIMKHIGPERYKINVTHITSSLADVQANGGMWMYIQNAAGHKLGNKYRGIRLVAARDSRILGGNKSILIAD